VQIEGVVPLPIENIPRIPNPFVFKTKCHEFSSDAVPLCLPKA